MDPERPPPACLYCVQLIFPRSLSLSPILAFPFSRHPGAACRMPTALVRVAHVVAPQPTRLLGENCWSLGVALTEGTGGWERQSTAPPVVCLSLRDHP